MLNPPIITNLLQEQTSRNVVCLCLSCVWGTSVPRGMNKSHHFLMSLQGLSFSVLKEEDSGWDSGDVWTNLALYVFTLHIPFSFGGLSVVSLLSRQPHLHPQIQALSLLTIQILELFGALVLLKYTAKPQHDFMRFFKNSSKSLNDRNWFLASALGFGFLVLLIFLTSLLSDGLSGPKPVYNPILKEMLLDSDVSRVSCVLVYCIFTPLLEELVYRGFLLTSLCTTMEWHQAVAISSIIFSAIHFSGESFLQLFIVGCVLGCSYCWTGNLVSSIAIHSFYNALTLLLTYFH
ncbi:hypothetical protein PIB30_030903 [Stylosanthes scabra]|uniref:CAAX prenyl protease 2/Lysostaphin resistance protein A-like domain-containing protein n=1 Tax=Stylosanthes scabra TaxID=79078 RepID=A0ABU6YE50_9FABA|nr:hypothetical protein [Stylosanthes scabra]